jgi:hypothetical protein
MELSQVTPGAQGPAQSITVTPNRKDPEANISSNSVRILAPKLLSFLLFLLATSNHGPSSPLLVYPAWVDCGCPCTDLWAPRGVRCSQTLGRCRGACPGMAGGSFTGCQTSAYYVPQAHQPSQSVSRHHQQATETVP